jgi:hypothetical protein
MILHPISVHIAYKLVYNGSNVEFNEKYLIEQRNISENSQDGTRISMTEIIQFNLF